MPIATAADDSLEYFSLFFREIRLAIPCQSSARQRSHRNYQALFSLLDGLLGSLRFNRLNTIFILLKKYFQATEGSCVRKKLMNVWSLACVMAEHVTTTRAVLPVCVRRGSLVNIVR